MRRFRKLGALLGGGRHLDDHRGRCALLDPVVGQRHSGAVAQKADALADGPNIDGKHGRLPQDVDTAQDLRYPIASSGSTMSEANIRSLRWRSPRPRASIHGT